jgi:hypothetical protein
MWSGRWCGAVCRRSPRRPSPTEACRCPHRFSRPPPVHRCANARRESAPSAPWPAGTAGVVVGDLFQGVMSPFYAGPLCPTSPTRWMWAAAFPLSEVRAMTSAPSICLFPPSPPPGPGATRRRGRPRGPLRASLARVIASGLSGCAESLAERTGWPPEAVRRTLWEMSRAGEVENQAPRDVGCRHQPTGIFAAASQREHVDALAFARQAWR